MTNKPIFQVSENDQGQRLDNYLLKQRKHIEKSNWYKLIRKGQVRINGKRVKPLHKLTSGDLVRIPASIFFVESSRLEVDPKYQNDLMGRVVFEDDDFLVLNKPAGMAVHAGTGQKIGVIEIVTSMADYVNTQLAHRLDKQTSGCLLLAKNRQALLRFQDGMKSQEVTKTYTAVLCGQLNHEVVIDRPLDMENRINGIRTVVVSDHGKSAKTTFTPLNSKGQYTGVECDIQSGRTHQIRVHAQVMGMPILGDDLYGSGNRGLARDLFLHAKSLKFKGCVFEAPLPEVFKPFF